MLGWPGGSPHTTQDVALHTTQDLRQLEAVRRGFRNAPPSTRGRMLQVAERYMAIHVDPEGRETAALRRVAPWPGSRVLEVGCGDGRLTLRLASLGAHVSAIDPEASLIRRARKALPIRFSRRVQYSVGDSGNLRFPSSSFDIVVFAWSL